MSGPVPNPIPLHFPIPGAPVAVPNEFSYRPGVPFTPTEALADQLCRATWTSHDGPPLQAPPNTCSRTTFNDCPDFYNEWMRCARFVERLLASGLTAAS